MGTKRRPNAKVADAEHQPKKHKDIDAEHQPKKRRRTNTVFDAKPIAELALPFCLAVAKFPCNALTAVWTKGQNRPVDNKQIDELVRIFKLNRLERTNERYRLCVLASQADVSRMREHLGVQGGDLARSVLNFLEWMSIIGSQVELIAGQHRVEALKQYVEAISGGESDLWWDCIVYDKDKLPFGLLLGLRTNRRDPTLPDNHGQIWLQLLSAVQEDSQLVKDSLPEADRNIIHMLLLENEGNIPVRRLLTLWKNTRWREITTRWCMTEVGCVSFNISTWEWLASLRIDDYWFAPLQDVLLVITALPGRPTNSISPADWQSLTQALTQSTYSPESLKLHFYPEPANRAVRAPYLLSGIDDEAYAEVFRRLATLTKFPDVYKMLKTSRPDCKIMMQVMMHVVSWANEKPTVVLANEVNKPLLRQDLEPAFQQRRCDSPGKLSVELQATVLDFVRDNIKPLRTSRDILFHSSVQDSNYADRFADRVWTGLLDIVRKYLGPNFKTAWKGRRQDPAPVLLASRIAKNVTAAISESHELPVPASPSKVRALSLDLESTIAAWIVQRCEEALQGSIPSTEKEAVQATLQRYRVIMDSPCQDHSTDSAPDEVLEPVLSAPSSPCSISSSLHSFSGLDLVLAQPLSPKDNRVCQHPRPVRAHWMDRPSAKIT